MGDAVLVVYKIRCKNMKNVVIVTWIGGGNYGTSLQSFALHKKLSDLGYNTSIVIPLHPIKNKLKSFIVRALTFVGLSSARIKRLLKGDTRTSKQRKLDRFEEQYCKKTICFPFQLSLLNRNTDVYVTGSDQIWNTAYRFDSFYFLDFASNVKRVAYASSMGINDFPEEHKPKVRNLLAKFSQIGVREETAVISISKLLNSDNVCQVLDPTFLLDKKEWIALSEKAEIEFELPSRFIFCYFVGNNPWYVEQVETVIRATGIQNVIQVCLNKENCVILSDADGSSILYMDAGPLEFVKLINASTFVCTDSFHATAISINLEHDFVEFMRFKDSDKSSQNSRIYDVLNHYGLSSRIYDKEKTEWAESIEYNEVTKKLESDRKESVDFLINAIEK